MNQNCYRIIFNKRRGMLMAVAETANSSGKSATGECQSAMQVTPQAHNALHPWRMLIFSLLASTLTPATAQVIADPTAQANQRPTILSDSQGRVMVNIQTPNTNGLSRNTYSQFDVPASGIGLNNSAANPWLSNGVLAKTILNEVNSTSQSYINGAITVYGAPAQVIVANPNGITINGGSFINANRATLTTGTAQINNGVLTGFAVRSGSITVGAAGLNNSTTPYTDMLSRVINISGKVQAQDLALTTGLQTVGYQDGLIGEIDTKSYTPGGLAVDTANLGGMYANNITILATETGLGVRNQGTWQAAGGQIVVTADGLLQNLGQIKAGISSLASQNGHIENAGALQGENAVVLSAGGDARLFGAGLEQNTGSTVLIAAKGAVNLYNNPSHGAAKISSTSHGGQVSIHAGQNVYLGAGSQISAHGNVSLDSDATVSGSSTQLSSQEGQLTALAATGISLTNSTLTGKQVHLETGAPFKDTAASIVVNGGSIRGQDQTTILATESIQIANPGNQAVSSSGNIHLQADKLVNITPGTKLEAGRHLNILAGTSLNLQASSGSTASNGQRVTLNAGQDMLLSANQVVATGSQLSAGQNLSVEANNGGLYLYALQNAGGSSADTINLTAGKDLNVSAYKGSLYATGLQAKAQNITLLSNGTTSISHANIKDGNNTKTIASTLAASEDITLGSIGTTPGAASQVQVIASRLDAGGQVRMQSNGDLLLLSGVETTVHPIATQLINEYQAPLVINAGSVAIKGATVYGAGANINANGKQQSSNRSGAIQITADKGALYLNSQNLKRTDYSCTTFSDIPQCDIAPDNKDDIRLTSSTMVQGSRLSSTGNIALHAQGNLTHWNTTAHAGGSFSSTSAAGQITVARSLLTANDVINLASKHAQTHDKNVYKSGAVFIFNESGHLSISDTFARAIYTDLPNVSGKVSIESGGSFGMNAGSHLYGGNSLAIVMGQGDIVINPIGTNRGTLDMTQLGSGGSLTLATRNGNLTFSGSPGNNGLESASYVKHYAIGDLNLIADNVTLQGSRLSTGGKLNITATKGTLTANALQVNQAVAGYTHTDWDAVQLEGKTGVALQAAGDIKLTTAQVGSSAAIDILSGGNATIAGNYTRKTVNNQPSGGWYQDETGLRQSMINGPAGVSIGAMGGTLTLNSAVIQAYNGQANLQALGDIRLEAGQHHTLADAVSTHTDRDWSGLVKKTYTTYHHREYLKNLPVSITAQDVSLKAGNTIHTYGSLLNASRNLQLQAGDAINYYAVYDQQDISDTTYKKSSFASISYSNSTTTNSTSKLSGQPTVLQSQGDILSSSGGNQLLQGTRVSYGGSAVFKAGVGEQARTDARIILEGIKNTVVQTRTQEGDYVVWQKQLNQGSKDETLILPSFNGPTKPVFSAPGGLSVQIPAGDFRTQINTLATQPGMAYLNDLAARQDINWQPVKLAHDTWDYRQAGLTPAGAALLSVAVAWATAGSGAALLGTTGTTTTAAANAALSSLAAQASITLINNKGDIGKTLNQLANSQTVKATVAAALTAGVLDKLGATSTMAELNKSSGFTDKLTYNLINATGRALTNTAIQGGSLQDALKTALISGLVDTAHGQVASQIKLLETDYLAHKLAHALAGCVAGAAAQGTCRDGAIGSAVGEIVAGMFQPANGMFYTEAEKSNVLLYSKLVAGAVSTYAGGDGQTAITTSEVAVQNNAFFVPPLIYMLAAAAGYTTVAGGGNPVTGLQSIGQGNDPLSKAMANGTQAAVSLSMTTFPKETASVLNFLNWAGGNIGQTVNATVTYVDDKTGRVVSTQWNSLSPATRDALIGAGKVASVVVSAAGVQSIKTFMANPQAVDWVPSIKLRGASWEDYLGHHKYKDYLPLNEAQANHKTFDFFDPDTGHAVSAKTMDTLGLTQQGGKPMTAKNAERYLRNYISDAVTYDKARNQPNGLVKDLIKFKSIELAIPHGTPTDIRQALERAATLGRAEGVQVRITVTAK